MTYTQRIFMRRSLRTNKEGFTLIELMLVIAVAGILLGGSFFIAKTLMDRAKRTSTQSILRGAKIGIENFHTDTDNYPATLQDLIRQPEGERGKGWAGPYLDKKSAPKDGWGNQLVYRVTPEGQHPYELYSYGPGGKKGKTKIDAWEI